MCYFPDHVALYPTPPPRTTKRAQKNIFYLKSNDTNKTYKNTNTFTCNTEGVIYLITCLKCHKQYVGQSGRKAKTRCKEHVTYIRNNTEATGKHFNERGHTHWEFKFHIIEKVTPNIPQMRLAREDYWIQILQSKAPNGLNKKTSH